MLDFFGCKQVVLRGLMSVSSNVSCTDNACTEAQQQLGRPLAVMHHGDALTVVHLGSLICKSSSPCLCVQEILPEAHLECINSMFTEDKAEQLLSGGPDYVLDAIDNIDTKVALIAACKRKGIKVLSVAGAGAKVTMTDISPLSILINSQFPQIYYLEHEYSFV